MGREWDLLIVDECHYCKNPKAGRTKKVLGVPQQWGRKDGSWYVKKARVPGLIDQSKKKVFLTGTPILNRPAEIFALLQALDPQTWRSKSKFEKRYCAAAMTRWGWDASGASNLDELQQKLRSTIMIRRKKADVLKELPAKRRQVVILPSDSREMKTILKEQKELLEGLELDGELLDNLNSQVGHFSELSALRKMIAMAKLPSVIDYLDNMIEEGIKKIVVFAHHHDVVDALMDHYGANAVRLDGRMNIDQKQQSIDAFQNTDVQIFVASIKAAGVGITLTAASHCVFAEISWTPADLSQAEDRLHRIGQLNSVSVQHLIVDGSLDAYMIETIIQKQEIIDQAVEANNLPDPDVGSKASDPLANAGSKASDPKVKKATVSVKKKEALAEALQLLAGMCDGAREEDGMGFNKVDTNFGKALAIRSLQRDLTDKEFFAGAKMARKYKKQVSSDLYETIYG
jgi:SWI/SNF-related matrix-associated actin-dependent regulator 1 of chromatin subfamily A